MISGFSSFPVLISGFGVGAAVILGWVFRSTSAPFALKVLLPAMLTGLAAGMPFAIGALMGYPVDTDFESLPQSARLVAVIEYEQQSKVDLWLQERDRSPRAWRIDETVLDRKALAQARRQISLGASVYVLRGMGAEGQHFTIKGLERPPKD